MPVFQVFLSELNEIFGPEGIGQLDAGAFAEGRSLSDELPLRVAGLRSAIDALPLAIHDAIRAVLRSAIQRRMPVAFAWAPGYDYRLSVWDVASTNETRGGITVLIETRYPDDPHPLYGTMQELAARLRGASG